MTGGIITAPQPEAVEAGADILRSGGNAVDAAVACALVQTAVDPIMCGVAGFGSMQIYMPGTQTHRFIDFHAHAPQAVRAEMWEHLVLGEADDGFGFVLEGAVNEIGYQSIMTPMTLRALDIALRDHGTGSLSDLIQPAIAYCEDGFAIRPHMSAFWNQPSSFGRVAHREHLTRFPAARAIYTRLDGTLLRVGQTLKNPDMARTYRRIAESGVDDFYSGSIASEILADMQRNGGLLSADDLMTMPTSTAPPWGTYRGHRVATNNPPGGGVMILEMLNILENFDLAAMGHNSPDYIAVLSEAMKIATVDKDAKVGDPHFVDVPVAELTSKAYGTRMAEHILSGEKFDVARMNSGNDESKDTTQICVVDADGNCVTMTHSIGMPSGVITEGLGFMYNGCMGVFDPRPGRAGSLAPGKSRFTAMCPTMLFDDDGPWLVIGAPGGTFITMSVLQGILNVVDFGMSAQEAASAPRFCTTSNTIDITNRIPRRTERTLIEMGYPVRRSALSYHFGAVHALRRTASGWDGGADPARDGMAMSV